MSDNNPGRILKKGKKLLLYTSYCDDKTNCTENYPCKLCLSESNVFVLLQDVRTVYKGQLNLLTKTRQRKIKDNEKMSSQEHKDDLQHRDDLLYIASIMKHYVCLSPHGKARAQKVFSVLNDDEKNKESLELTPPKSTDHERGKSEAYSHIIRECIRETPQKTDDWRIERLETIKTLRLLCEEFGDNNWNDNLHLSDIIKKHLDLESIRYDENSYDQEIEQLDQEIEQLDQERGEGNNPIF